MYIVQSYEPMLEKFVHICCRIISTNEQHVSEPAVDVTQKMWQNFINLYSKFTGWCDNHSSNLQFNRIYKEIIAYHYNRAH